MRLFLKKPSPALLVAMLALFVAMGGAATAAGVVPLAKRALLADKAKKAAVADNAKKLGGRSLAQLNASTASAITASVEAAAAKPRPASSAADLVVVKSQHAVPIAPDFVGTLAALTCDAGQKVMGGGLAADGLVITIASHPASDTTWSFSVVNLTSAPATASLWITCLK